MNIILFAFAVILICASIMCIYATWIATLLTIELVQEWWKDNKKGIRSKLREYISSKERY